MTSPRIPNDLHVPLVVNEPPVAAYPEVYPSGPVASPPTAVAPAYADLPAPPPAYREEREARRRHRTPLAWLPWALLAGIIALLLLSLLAAALSSSDDKPSSKASDGTSQTGSGTGGSTAGAGVLTAGGVDVLGTPGALRGQVGQAAVGRRAPVQSVVSDEGFWVGTSSTDRVFVHLSRASRGNQAESPYQVKTGDSIDLAGSVQRATASTGKAFGVTASEGAAQLTREGAYIEATRVSLSS